VQRARRRHVDARRALAQRGVVELVDLDAGHYRRQTLDVDADHDALRISSWSFTTVPITIAYRDLAHGEHCQFRLLKPEERDRDENRRKAN
jgi:hypothetical protein